MQTIVDIIASSKAKNKILLLDCCKGGAFTIESDIPTATLHSKGISDSGIAIITASRSTEFAFEKKYSTFTECIIEGITEKDPDYYNSNTITIFKLCDYIQAKFRNNHKQKPVFSVYGSHEIPIIEYSNTKQNTLRSSENDFPGRKIIRSENGWEGLIDGDEYSFLLCYIEITVNDRIKNDRDFWNDYVNTILFDKHNQKIYWKPWIVPPYGKSKIFYCPLSKKTEAISQVKKAMKIFLNKTYNDFAFDYNPDDVTMKIIINVENIKHSNQINHVNININHLSHLEKKLEPNKLYFWGWGIHYLPENMKKQYQIERVAKDNLYAITIT